VDENDFGALIPDGNRWRLTFTRRLAHPIEKVWRAVTEPSHLEAWFPQKIVGDRRAGAPLRFETTTGTDQLRIELSTDGDGTVLRLIDTFDDLGKAARDAAGWHECLARLEASLDEVALPATGSVWRELHPIYVSRLGPEASTIGPPAGYEP
jgi:uncharacterized protein YndB with AHSA1/START domain